MRKIRVKHEKAEALVRALRQADIQARYLGPGSAYSSLHNGCSDPGHCPQHPCYYNPQDWGCIEAECSGRKAHRIWVAAGLVEPFPYEKEADNDDMAR